jgi:phospholipid/cholesterol/gamma-HCH transport system permease protein
MQQAANFHIETREGSRTVVLTGDWTAVELGGAGDRLARSLGGSAGLIVDMTQVARCDTSGAFEVLRALQLNGRPDRILASPDVDQLLKLVADARKVEPTRMIPSRPVTELFERIGKGVLGLRGSIFDTMAFNGQLLVATGRALANPGKIRWAAVFSLAERAGLDAIPIVALTSFFIGAVVALIGANLLRQFGAQVFVVELIGVSVLREFNVLITALLLAGRSASSFAAELGSMKMNQEVDAMRVLGIDPFDALVFPRFAALLITVPLLVFAATLAGLAGGLAVASTVLGINAPSFFHRLVENVGLTHFWVGLSKAPVMAVVIASIGCRQGMDVGGDVESLGRHVTSAVVEAIFSAILIDAVFALIYMNLNI